MTHKGRDYIIDEVLLKAIPAPRAEVSEYAPKMITMKINPLKRSARSSVSGGKVIQKITADTGAKIDIEDDGSVFIFRSRHRTRIDAAKTIIDGIVFEPEVGCDLRRVSVTRIIPIGAFVEFAPGKEGTRAHLQALKQAHVEKVEDVCRGRRHDDASSSSALTKRAE